MKFHGLVTVLAHDHTEPAREAWGHIRFYLDTDPARSFNDRAPVEQTLLSSVSMADTEAAAVRQATENRAPLVWRFIAGRRPKKMPPGKWIFLPDDEVRAMGAKHPKISAYSWLAGLVAMERLRAIGTWPPPPTDEWPEANEDPRQVGLFG